MNNNAISWLLGDDNPAVKYRTLTEIISAAPDNDTDALYRSIWAQKPIVKMLEKQDENGLWSTKDWGVHTSLRYLTAFAEQGLCKDERLDRFVDYTVQFLQSFESKGDLAGCANALTLRALVMLGYHCRSDVWELLAAFASTQLYDGGFNCKRLLDRKPGRKSCYRAALNSLMLYAECKRADVLPGNANELIEYFLRRSVFYASDRSKSLVGGKPGWRIIDNFFPVEPMRIGLPLIVAALAILGAGSAPETEEAWTLLREKEDENGRLALEGTLVKQPCSFGKTGQPNKWVTFYAALAEKYATG